MDLDIRPDTGFKKGRISSTTLITTPVSRDAVEIVEGYGTQAATSRQKKSFWSEQDEQKLADIFRWTDRQTDRDTDRDTETHTEV